MTTWTRQLRMAEEELRSVLRDLPPELRRKAQEIEVVLERRPSAALLEDGVDPDLMGLFEGASLAEPEGEGVMLPSRILLFLDSIWEEAEGREEAYREEVRLTLAHELGHYLGLDESDLAARDVE
jgi:predicted Zn-dependent protease with MMP-like domain